MKRTILKSLMWAGVIGLVFIFHAALVRAQSSLDGFDPNANDNVYGIVVQADGKILISGNFTQVAGVTRNRIARLNPDGTLDASFDPNANNRIDAITVQADGKILIGGDFTALAPNGGATVTRNRIARLNADGTLDASFDPNANAFVFSIVVQADGKILIGGDFNTLAPNGGAAVTRRFIARLESNGPVDASFDPNADNALRAIAVQPDGKIIIGGIFTALAPNGGAAVTRNRIARLNPDGTLDASFDPNANSFVLSIALQPDGKILIGGFFQLLAPNGGATITRNHIARLETSGLADASFDPNANAFVRAVAVQANGKILFGGDFTALAPGGSVPRSRIARVEPSGLLDSSFDPNAGFSVFSIAEQADGKILAGGDFTTMGGQTRNRVARLEGDGRIDQTLSNLNDQFSTFHAIAIQPDGKILIGGQFSSILGQPRFNIARLNTDGTLDTTFNPNIGSTFFRAIAVQPDGKILIGGNMNHVQGVTRNNIARLNPDGTLDHSFNPNANNSIESVLVLSDGRIVIGGNFTTLAPNFGAAVTRNRIARLNSDGTLDASFDPNANNSVVSIAAQSDGRIIIGGFFTTLAPNGGAVVTRNYIARFESNGLLDASFDPNPNSIVASIAAQPDGKILIGGAFIVVSPSSGGGAIRRGFARLESNGLLDASFDPNPGGGVTNSIVALSDGSILIGGTFTSLSPNGGPIVMRNRIARLESNGLVDPSFDPNADHQVSSIAAQPDGKVIVGGFFSNIGGQPRNGFARLSNNTAALSNLSATQTAVTWTLDGSSPRFNRVTFEQSTDGVNYTFLGNGMGSFAPFSEDKGKSAFAPQASVWTLTGLNLPTGQNLYIRARGFYQAGYQNGSESITETVRNAFLVIAYEADVASRPNGDGLIISDDVVQIRRFLNGTHTADQTTNEFQRSDSAPIATLGDGKILSDDVVQARRYQNGTNPKQPAGGPTTQSFARATETAVDNFAAKLSNTTYENALIGNSREVRVESTNGTVGQPVTVNIRVNAVGNEAEYGFIISYDTSVLSMPTIGAGNAGASVRSCNIATAGQINCSVGGFPNNQAGSSDAGIGEIAAGMNQILITVQFQIAANAQPGSMTQLTLSNVNASSDAPQLFTPTATNGTVTILAPTAAASQISGRVMTADGRGVFRARLTLTDRNGEARSALTNPFGYYRFSDVAAGETYIIGAEHKRYRFETRVITVNESLSEVDFIAADSLMGFRIFR